MPFANDRLEQNRQHIEQRQIESELKVVRMAHSRFLFDPVEVIGHLQRCIVGQDDVLAAIRDLITVVKADISDRDRPLSVSLFLGPTGVGKTEIVRQLAKAIHGRTDAFCRIDMNTLSQDHYAAALTGAPPGYVGSKEGTTLLDADQIQGSFGRPGIVLFDEIEKASKEVQRSLLNILDSGHLTLSSGHHKIDFRNTLIFMTSNIGALEASQYHYNFNNSWRRWLGQSASAEAEIQDKALHSHFDPEFLNRIDRILKFKRIAENFLPAIVEIEIAKLNQRMASQGRKLILTDSAVEYLCKDHDPRFGARHIARKLRTQLEPVLADYLINTSIPGDILAEFRSGQLQVDSIPVDDFHDPFQDVGEHV